MTDDQRWSIGIGDPTALGWFTVIAYFSTAALCWYAASRPLQRYDSVSMATPFLWRLLSVLLIVLGINKQLDFQSLLTQIGKDMAIAQGWYEQRRFIQLGFITALGILGAMGLAVIGVLLRYFGNAVRISLIGSALLVIFVLARASSFHLMDVLIDQRLLGMRLNGWLELGSISCIAFGAILYCGQQLEKQQDHHAASSYKQ